MFHLNESFSAHYRSTSTYEQFDYHSHHEYEIYFFHAGSCRYLIHNQIYDLEPGDIILMDGLTLHKPNVYLPKEYIRSVLHFSPQSIQKVLAELGSPFLLDVFEGPSHRLIRTHENAQSQELEFLIDKIDTTIQERAQNDQLRKTELNVLLIQALIIVYQLSQTHQVPAMQPKAFKDEYIEDIATYIQAHFMEKLSLNMIANALNMSKSYVSHLFKDMTGFTVMEYVMGCRLTHAKYLLEMAPDKKIEKVAYESGFESASHFSRYFRQKTGLTAKDYRRHRLNISAR